MDIGLACSFAVPTGQELTEAISASARAAESLGLATFWAAGDREAGAERAHDPTLGIFVVARATTKIRVGLSGDLTSVRTAAVRAKQIATIDWFSGGRLALGVDLGPPPAELVDPWRTDITDPTGAAAERYAAMCTLWTAADASYHGKHLGFDGAYAFPQPVGSRIPSTHVRATGTADLARFTETCGRPDGLLSWLASAEEVATDAAALAEATDDAAAVRRTWCVPAADIASARAALPDLGTGVDELVACFDHVPDEREIAALLS